MNAPTASELDPDLMWFVLAMSRLEWGYAQLRAGEDDPRWETSEFGTDVGEVLNEAGANLYYFSVTRSLKSATKCHQAAVFLLKEPYGAIPVENLLRAALLATVKVLFILQPNKRKSREARFGHLYHADRSSLEYAASRELKLLGLETPNDEAQQSRPQPIQESKIIRDVLDDLVAYGDCSCNDAACPQTDIKDFRHRVLRLWWQYSSVSHVNIWHIEKLARASPSGDGYTTGDLGRALHDLSWLYTEAVVRFHERYNLPTKLSPLEPHAARSFH